MIAAFRCSLALAALLLGCGGSSYDRLGEARGALAEASYADAIAAAEAGLQASPDAKTAWGLELVRLEAEARSGDGEAVLAQLTSLGERHPERLPPTQYSAAADQLRSAGQAPAAVQVLDMGLQRHPGDPLLEGLIGASSSGSDVDPAELEMLKSLGYIE